MLGSLFLLAAMTIPTQTLVLKSGERMPVEHGVTEDNGKVTFRSGGSLYSLPSQEVDFEATRAAAATIVVHPGDDRMRIKVPEGERQRLLRELAQNHKGKPPTAAQMQLPPPRVEEAPLEKAASEEWTWRRQARAHEEEIRTAKESLQLLTGKAERLQGEIRTFIGLGYKPSQFSYQSSELAYTLEQIPAAEGALQRAERSNAQFRDDARRLGVLPGWLR